MKLLATVLVALWLFFCLHAANWAGLCGFAGGVMITEAFRRRSV